MRDFWPVAAAGIRDVVRRFTGFGVTLVLVASLLYIARDGVPPAWIDRLTEMTGFGDSVSGAPGSRMDAPDGLGDTSTLPVREATPGDVDEVIAPSDGSGWEEAGEGVPPEEPPVTGPDAPAPTFVVNFSSGSDLLESDAWHTLDTAALLLREQPDRIAVITDSSSWPDAQALEPKLPGARIAAVEQYLMAAGIDRRRLRVRERALPETIRGPGAPEAEPAGTGDRSVHIFIDRGLPP